MNVWEGKHVWPDFPLITRCCSSCSIEVVLLVTRRAGTCQSQPDECFGKLYPTKDGNEWDSQKSTLPSGKDGMPDNERMDLLSKHQKPQIGCAEDFCTANWADL